MPSRSEILENTGDKNHTLRNWFMRTIALLGAVVTLLCLYRLPLQQLDLRYAFLVLVTIVIGSRITVQIPRAKGHISVSDTFIFLTMLMFGGEAAILLAAMEAFTSTVRFSKRLLVGLFNAGVIACSTAITVTVVSIFFCPFSGFPG